MKQERRWGRLLYLISGSLVALILIGLIILGGWSPGRIEPYIDENGKILESSISEIVKTEIGGIEQGMIIKGKNINNPILLFLHGGPGNPEYVLSESSNVGLENLFTVCWWEHF